MSSFANPNLDWMKIEKTLVGADISLMDNNLRISLDYYAHKTNPLVIAVPQAPHTGVGSYDMNLGYMQTRDVEFSVSYNVINRPEDRTLLNVRLKAGSNRQKYGGFGDAFEVLNKELFDDNNGALDEYYNAGTFISSQAINYMLQKYQDGADPDAIWVVRSLGIDPATGREVYHALEGTPTFEYNAVDRVSYRSTRPKLLGIFGFTFNRGNFQTSFNFRYSLGRYMYNDALFNKVENIDYDKFIYNQDRRALTDRWAQPGDEKPFRTLVYTAARGANRTQLTSRFVQKNNYLKGESIRIAWDFSNYGMGDIATSMYCINIPYIINWEWGMTDYDFDFDNPAHDLVYMSNCYAAVDNPNPYSANANLMWAVVRDNDRGIYRLLDFQIVSPLGDAEKFGVTDFAFDEIGQAKFFGRIDFGYLYYVTPDHRIKSVSTTSPNAMPQDISAGIVPAGHEVVVFKKFRDLKQFSDQSVVDPVNMRDMIFVVTRNPSLPDDQCCTLALYYCPANTLDGKLQIATYKYTEQDANGQNTVCTKEMKFSGLGNVVAVTPKEM